MANFVAAIRQVYRESRKKEDIFWNTYVARPLAAVLVHLLRPTPLTPNQVTFLGAFIFLFAAAAFIFIPGPLGFLVGALIVELSYLFDCADGQLARLKNMTSQIGGHLDFLMDEFKALLLVGALAVRLWMVDGQVMWLFIGLGALFLVSAATSLTNFIRRPEYAGQTIAPGESAKKRAIPKSLVGKVLWLVETVARYFVHYPSWIIWAAIGGFFLPLDTALLFLVPFLGVYFLYLGRTGLAVLLKLGRPGFYR